MPVARADGPPTAGHGRSTVGVGTPIRAVIEEGTLMRTFATVYARPRAACVRSRARQGVVLPLPPEDQQNITAQLGPGVVGIALPSQPIADPSVYFPLQDRSQQFPGRQRPPRRDRTDAWAVEGQAAGREEGLAVFYDAHAQRLHARDAGG